jgi:hypothetical protein
MRKEKFTSGIFLYAYSYSGFYPLVGSVSGLFANPCAVLPPSDPIWIGELGSATRGLSFTCGFLHLLRSSGFCSGVPRSCDSHPSPGQSAIAATDQPALPIGRTAVPSSQSHLSSVHTPGLAAAQSQAQAAKKTAAADSRRPRRYR